MRFAFIFVLASAFCGDALASDTRVNLFDTFNAVCIGSGPDYEKVVALLEERGATRLPDQAGANPDDPQKISGYALPGAPAISFMISKSGRCVAVSDSADVEATKETLAVFIEAWREKLVVTEEPVKSKASRTVLARYRADVPAGLALILTMFTEANENGSTSTYLVREIYTL